MEKKPTTPTGFGKHPSEKLQQVFSQKPYQIQCPEKAEIIFLGLDANWDKNIERDKSYFEETINYLSNGIKYWKDNGIHTPMLKDTYKGGGRRYHTQFRKLGFLPKDAEKICFLELLSICTYGSSTTNMTMFMDMLKSPENKKHLETIRKIFESENNVICIPKGVKRVIDRLGGGFNLRRKNVIIHTHFSGSVSDKELHNLGDKLRK